MLHALRHWHIWPVSAKMHSFAIHYSFLVLESDSQRKLWFQNFKNYFYPQYSVTVNKNFSHIEPTEILILSTFPLIYPSKPSTISWQIFHGQRVSQRHIGQVAFVIYLRWFNVQQGPVILTKFHNFEAWHKILEKFLKNRFLAKNFLSSLFTKVICTFSEISMKRRIF
jgi:hypothetical protein